MDQVYFANKSNEELGNVLKERVDGYYTEVGRNGRRALWAKTHQAFYAVNEGGQHQATKVERKGERQEYSTIKINHFRNLLINIHVIITQQRPSYECRSINNDYRSKVQTILASNILEYYLRERRLEEHFRKTAELCLQAGEGYLELSWDKDAGEDYMPDPETGAMHKSGDVRGRVYHPIDVVRPIIADSDMRPNWYILRRFEARHDLAARHPEFTETILAASDDGKEDPFSMGQSRLPSDWESDYIPCFYFYHDRTPACPEGRQAVFLSDGTVLVEGALAYKSTPVYRMMAYDQHGTAYGYTVAFDLLAVQDGIDLLNGIIMSNQATFGVQNIWLKPGSNLSTTQLGQGLNVFESAEKPESINLTSTPAEIFNYLSRLEGNGETISGVNSVARGQPEASLKSGSALALVASQAVQFANGVAAAYARLIEDSGTGLLRIIQEYATVPRTAAIAGKANRTYMKEFVGDDIKDINRVVVDVGNPISRTLSGRVQMAQDLLQAQLLKKPEQYIQVIQTGKLDPMIQDQQSELLLIDAENELLREGKQVPVIAVDEHIEHIAGHRAVLADPGTRQIPEVVEATLSHIQEHISALRTVDPSLLNVLGQKSLAPSQDQPPPQGGNVPPPPPQDAPPPQAGQQMPAPPNASPEMAAQMPSMPQPPPGTPDSLA